MINLWFGRDRIKKQIDDRFPENKCGFVSPGSLVIFGMLLFIGCIPPPHSTAIHHFPETAVTPKERDIRKEWKSYGAYYSLDDVSFSVSTGSTPPRTWITVKKHLEILTMEGARYATLDIPAVASRLSSFNVTLYDSNNVPVEIDVEAIKQKFIKTDVVVVPNVTAGCRVELEVVSYVPVAIPAFEQWFAYSIPIEKGRFSFAFDDNIEFHQKTYGTIPDPLVDESGRNRTYTWKFKDYLPPGRIGNLPHIDTWIPRVSIVARRAYNQDIFTSWSKLVNPYREASERRSYFASKQAMNHIVDSLSRENDNVEAKAAAILDWVQENVLLRYRSASPSINPDKIISMGQGTIWETTVILRDMFSRLGLSTDIIITRARDKGGFDPEFVSPRALDIPLVTVKIDTTEHIAYPFTRGAYLGEYPGDFFGLHGLSISFRRTRPLPPPRSSELRTIYDYTIDLSKRPPEQTVRVTFEGYLAYSLRTGLFSLGKKTTKEFFQAFLTELGHSNALETCDVHGIEDKGEPIYADISFVNPAQAIHRDDMHYLTLSNLFSDWFSSYDTSRISPVSFKKGKTLVERIRLIKDTSMQVKIAINCLPVANKMFSSSCTEKDSGAEYHFSRISKIKPLALPADSMKTLYGDIVKLNKIVQSYVVLSPKTVSTITDSSSVDSSSVDSSSADSSSADSSSADSSSADSSSADSSNADPSNADPFVTKREGAKKDTVPAQMTTDKNKEEKAKKPETKMPDQELLN